MLKSESISAFICLDCQHIFATPIMYTKGQCFSCGEILLNYMDCWYHHSCVGAVIDLPAAHYGISSCTRCRSENLDRILAIDCLKCPGIHLPNEIPEHCIGTTISHKWTGTEWETV